MPALKDVKALNSALIQSQPLVAVFFGGTGGIGHATLCELVKAEAASGKGLRAYVVGRDASAGEKIMEECRATYPKGDFRFVKAVDLSLLKEVDRICAEITQMEERESADSRIDYLMMGQGGWPFKARTDTAEGIDENMSLMYYSRMKIILNLLPLLLKSTLPASVVSVYAGGMEAKLFPDDLSLREPNRHTYSLARSHMVYMHTLFFESLAAQHPGKLRLVHVFPGLVLGPAFRSGKAPTWFRLLCIVLIPLIGRFVSVPLEECGQRMVSLASTQYPSLPVGGTAAPAAACVGTDGKAGSGVYALGATGESVIKLEAYTKFDKDEMRSRVWEHTTKAFSVIGAGKRFTE